MVPPSSPPRHGHTGTRRAGDGPFRTVFPTGRESESPWKTAYPGREGYLRRPGCPQPAPRLSPVVFTGACPTRRAEARPGGGAWAAAAAGGRAREVQVLDLKRPADSLQPQARLVFRVQLARHLQSARRAQAEAASRGAMRRQLRAPVGWRAQRWELHLAVDRVENAVRRAAPFSRAGVLFTSIRGEGYSHE